MDVQNAKKDLASPAYFPDSKHSGVKLRGSHQQTQTVGRTMSRYLCSFVFSMAFFVAFSLKHIQVSQKPRMTLTAKGKCEYFCCEYFVAYIYLVKY